MSVNDWIGSVGVGLIRIAYFCSTFRLMLPNSPVFFILNALGAALACLASYLISYWPFVILEATWTIVSLVGFFRSKANS